MTDTQSIATPPQEDEDSDKPSVLDGLVGRLASKKLIAFAVATVLLFLHIITNDQWYFITLAYIGGQHVHDLAINWKHGPGAAQGMPESS